MNKTVSREGLTSIGMCDCVLSTPARTGPAGPVLVDDSSEYS